MCCILFHLLKGLHFPFPGEAGSEIATGQGMETNQFFRNARLLLFKKGCYFGNINVSPVVARPKVHNDGCSFRTFTVSTKIDEGVCITGPNQDVVF